MSTILFEKFENEAINETMLRNAAKLFSHSYGKWGSLAAVHMGTHAQEGRRVRMSADRLKQQCLPINAQNTYVRATSGEELIGNVFACRWVYQGRNICWVTQLVVDSEFRNQKIATKLLHKLREGEQDHGFGILSSHPAALMAALRAFGRGIEEVDLQLAQEHAVGIMQASPVEYVKNATLHGSIFDADNTDGSVCSANTNFWVDHTEPSEALRTFYTRHTHWPFGALPQGHEYLVLIEAKVEGRCQAQKSSEF